ncbi:monosaccharide ABC transporter ATP-binding protein, CUT2 family (TC 3.A.1.2.-) [Alteromonadaceae bacterium Bs31]|nr:monosaccharide ABC transporter ATP-binding protein, CUT2 family (TC 3.A.1.2.-) [Alteromonadaceae bacterium Bs31]
MSGDAEVLLEASNVSKSFPGVRALDKVSLTLRRGRLTALLGENGAGKSTLMNIISGVFKQDEGEIKLAGETVSFNNTREAQAAGIAMIYQELNLVSNLSVAENIFLGREPLNPLGFIDRKKMHCETEKLLQILDLDVSPATPLNHLRVGQQQVVEIAKALSCDARVLIMDEPTSAITEHEIDVLFGIIDKLKAQGVAIAYITHKLEELTRIGDDAVVMRDGKLIGAAPLKDLSRDEIITMMVGREMAITRKRSDKVFQRSILSVANLALRHHQRNEEFVLKDIDMNVQQGEVLGIFGLMGAGRTELLECLFGLHPKLCSAQYKIDGKLVAIRSPAKAIENGLALAPEDRKKEGLVLGMSVSDNTSLACLSKYQRFGFIDRPAEAKLVNETIARFKVKTPSPRQQIRNLSGGNQQKVILGKWLATKPRVLLLDEPTRGIDINAKAEIYALIQELGEAGLSVILVSSELPEILAMSDRIMVMCEGRKTAEIARADANEENIMKAALPQGVTH